MPNPFSAQIRSNVTGPGHDRTAPCTLCRYRSRSPPARRGSASPRPARHIRAAQLPGRPVAPTHSIREWSSMPVTATARSRRPETSARPRPSATTPSTGPAPGPPVIRAPPATLLHLDQPRPQQRLIHQRTPRHPAPHPPARAATRSEPDPTPDAPPGSQQSGLHGRQHLMRTRQRQNISTPSRTPTAPPSPPSTRSANARPYEPTTPTVSTFSGQRWPGWLPPDSRSSLGPPRWPRWLHRADFGFGVARPLHAALTPTAQTSLREAGPQPRDGDGSRTHVVMEARTSATVTSRPSIVPEVFWSNADRYPTQLSAR